MALFLLCLLAVAAANPTPVTWYLGRPSKSDLRTLIEKNCYHGTYGANELSLFTCTHDGMGLEEFATVASGTPLCFVEVAHPLEAKRYVELSLDARILWNNAKEMIVGGLAPKDTYPSICLSSSDYNGAALNVIQVTKHSFKPSTLNVLADIKVRPEPNDLISDFLAQVTATQLKTWDTTLAYGPSGTEWNTRQSISKGANLSVEWVTRQFQTYGLVTRTEPFRTGYCSNVIGEIRGATRPLEIVIVGSHLDSRSTGVNDPAQVAPGADDNGSGSATNVEFARLIQANNVKFNRTLRLITFCGEEQGLYGSAYNAQQSKARNETIVAMINVDMIGYLRPGTTPTIGFATGSTTPALVTSCKNIVASYVPSVGIGNTTACCSDQQSYYSQGYPSLSFFETPTSSVVYPDYHRSTDTPDKVNFDQVRLFAQGVYACALSSAQAYK
jgi:hypothetical protein